MLLRFYQKLRGRDDSDPCLYIFPFSLHSIMVQFTIALALRNKSQSSRELGRIKYRLVNLHRNENLSEDYLVHVNPRGKVPALTAKSIPAPLTDSLSISYWVCEQHPSLIPETHRTTIQRLLSQLHRIQADNNPNPAVDDILARTDISLEHRRALEHKRDWLLDVTPEVLAYVTAENVDWISTLLLTDPGQPSVASRNVSDFVVMNNL
ncbi:hypothetical protein BDV37DRAFT_275649 [Aspergillus pseudonomiae]|uniref:GST N-terminal domain-containing protein n=1 Tax=Aspergillus pseudonomiae TaxID=1506151 RepID=A0A5N7CYH8_9EURO|nr:uncharacterized protein BDV37DRAFT_275649 [Aspergillus pseudonomiae]KAE8399019.1 hypothetical protein BDV37DRAFT_275649 [Aspergillus pseudonomiae]